MNDESKLSIEALLSRAGNSDFARDTIRSEYIGLATAKIQMENNALIKRSHEIAEKQLNVSNEANDLTRRLLASNDQSSKENEKNAELMSSATLQLAESTKSLNRATWVLVGFTSLQALIAFAALYLSILAKK